MAPTYAYTSTSGRPALSNCHNAMASILSPSVATHITEPPTAPEIELACVLYIHTTPYIPAAWQDVISISNLLPSFPNLVHGITYGFPIGNPPPLSRIFLPPNLVSGHVHPEII